MKRWGRLLPRGSARHGIARTAAVTMTALMFNMAAGVIVARQLGPEGRGHFAAIMAWYAVALIVGDIGQTASVTYHVARWSTRAADFIATARRIISVSGALVGLTGILFANYLAGDEREVAWAYRIAFAGCLLHAFTGPWIFALQAAAIDKWNNVRLAQPIAYLLFIIAFQILGGLSLIALSCALVLSISVQGILARRYCKGLHFVRGRPDKVQAKSLLSYGVPQAAAAVPASLAANIDKIALSRIVSAGDLGQYSVASTVISLGALLAAAVGNVMFPLLSRTGISTRARVAAEWRSFWATVVGVTISGVCLAAASGFLVPLVFGDGFERATRVVFWLIPALIAGTAAHLVGDLLRARRMPASVAVAQWLGVSATGAAILVLGPKYGLEGTAVATGIGQSVCLLVSLLALKRARTLDRGESDD